MRILFDSKSVQVQEQQQTKTRLNALLGAIKSAGTSMNDPWRVSYSGDRITSDRLARIDVLVVLTRNPGSKYAYTAHELDAIAGYVNGGGNLFLMTSHPPNFTSDAPLASRFGVILRHSFVSLPMIDRQAINPMVMSGRSLNRSLARGLLFQVAALIAHDSCEIVAPAEAIRIAAFPPGAVAKPGGRSPKTKDFAIALRHGAGKVIVVGNSGMVGDYGSTVPACGLAPLGSNLLFFLNCVRFLAGLPTPSHAGLCPGEAPPTP